MRSLKVRRLPFARSEMDGTERLLLLLRSLALNGVQRMTLRVAHRQKMQRSHGLF